MQAAPSQVACGAQLPSCTAWRQGAVGQDVQISKQTPEGSHWGLLDSPEHTDFSQLATQKPLLPLAGLGEDLGVAAQADLDPEAERAEGSRQRPQDWSLSSVPQEQAVL